MWLLYVHLLEVPKESEIIINSLNLDSGTKIESLANKKQISWENHSENLKLKLPHELPESPTVVLKITFP